MKPPDPVARLRHLRRLIDVADTGLWLLWSGRRRLAARAGLAKRAAGLPLRDRARETAVELRAHRLACWLDLPATESASLTALLVEDACRLQQADANRAGSHSDLVEHLMTPLRTDLHATESAVTGRGWLRLLPPPSRWAPLFKRVPGRLHSRTLRMVCEHALETSRQAGAFGPIEGRRIGIAIVDLGLGWTLCMRPQRIDVEAGTDRAESVVHGSLTDLLALASRLEDADTLFFQRRLQLTGDVELGLTARNLLDQLDWEQLPLASRIVLHRCARFARMARAAHSA